MFIQFIHMDRMDMDGNNGNNSYFNLCLTMFDLCLNKMKAYQSTVCLLLDLLWGQLSIQTNPVALVQKRCLTVKKNMARFSPQEFHPRDFESRIGQQNMNIVQLVCTEQVLQLFACRKHHKIQPERMCSPVHREPRTWWSSHVP